MKLSHFVLIGLVSFGFALSANAGSVTDTDGDLVPDPFDNCLNLANGPNEASNQIDHDTDGYGTACDGDYNNTDPNVDLSDFNLFLASFGDPNTSQFDHDNGGSTDLNDFNAFLGFFGGPPGPSGLSCAGSPPCTP